MIKQLITTVAIALMMAFTSAHGDHTTEQQREVQFIYEQFSRVPTGTAVGVTAMSADQFRRQSESAMIQARDEASSVYEATLSDKYGNVACGHREHRYLHEPLSYFPWTPWYPFYVISFKIDLCHQHLHATPTPTPTPTATPTATPTPPPTPR